LISPNMYRIAGLFCGHFYEFFQYFFFAPIPPSRGFHIPPSQFALPHRSMPCSGVDTGNLRELALARMKELNLKCRDVRTREVGAFHSSAPPWAYCRGGGAG